MSTVQKSSFLLASTLLLSAAVLTFAPRAAIAGCSFNAERLCADPRFRDSHDPAACARSLTRYQNLVRSQYRTLDHILNSGDGKLVQAAQYLGVAWNRISGVQRHLPAIRDRMWSIHGRVGSLRRDIALLRQSQPESREFTSLLQVIRRDLHEACDLISVIQNQMIGTGTAYAVRSRNTALVAGAVGAPAGAAAGSAAMLTGSLISISLGGTFGDGIFPWRARQQGVAPPLPEPPESRRLNDEEETFVEVALEEPLSSTTSPSDERRSRRGTDSREAANPQSPTRRPRRPRRLEGSDPVTAERALEEIEVSELPAARTRTNRQIARELRDMVRSRGINRDLLELTTDREINQTTPGMRPTEGEYTYMLSRFHEALDSTIEAHGEDNPDWAGLVDAIADRFTSDFFNAESGPESEAPNTEVLGALLNEGANDEVRALFMAVALNEIQDRLPSYIQIGVEVNQNRVQTVLHDTQTGVVHDPYTWENHDAGRGRLYGVEELAAAMFRRTTGRRQYAAPQVEERPEEELPALAGNTRQRRRPRNPSPARSRSDERDASQSFRWARSHRRVEEEQAPSLGSVLEARPSVALTPSSPDAENGNDTPFDDEAISARIRVPEMLSREDALSRMHADVLANPDRVAPGTIHRLASVQAQTYGGVSRTEYEEGMRHYLTSVEIARQRIQGVSDPIQQGRIADEIALQRHMSEYFIDNTRIIHALVGNRRPGRGINCQGDGQFTPGFYADVGVAQVPGQPRGLQNFTDHVQAVRYDPATRTATTLLEQRVDGGVGQIRSPIMREGYLNFVALRGAGYTEAEIGATMESFVLAEADPEPPSENPITSVVTSILSSVAYEIQTMGLEENGMEWGQTEGSVSYFSGDGEAGLPVIPRRATRTISPAESAAPSEETPENPGLWAQVRAIFSEMNRDDDAAEGSGGVGSGPWSGQNNSGLRSEVENRRPIGEVEALELNARGSEISLDHTVSEFIRLDLDDDQKTLYNLAVDQLRLPMFNEGSRRTDVISDVRRERFTAFSDEVARRWIAQLPMQQQEALRNPTAYYRLSPEAQLQMQDSFRRMTDLIRQTSVTLAEHFLTSDFAIQDSNNGPVRSHDWSNVLLLDALQDSPTLRQLAQEELDRLRYARANPARAVTSALRSGDPVSGPTEVLRIATRSLESITSNVAVISSAQSASNRHTSIGPLVRQLREAERETAVALLNYAHENISVTPIEEENNRESPPRRHQPQVRIFVPAIPPERQRRVIAPRVLTSRQPSPGHVSELGPNEYGERSEGINRPGQAEVRVSPLRREQIRIEADPDSYLRWLRAVAEADRSPGWYLNGRSGEERLMFGDALLRALQPEGMATQSQAFQDDAYSLFYVNLSVGREPQILTTDISIQDELMGRFLNSQQVRSEGGLLKFESVVGEHFFQSWLASQDIVHSPEWGRRFYDLLQRTSSSPMTRCQEVTRWAALRYPVETDIADQASLRAWSQLDCAAIARNAPPRR